MLISTIAPSFLITSINQALLEELCRIQQTVLVEEVTFHQLKNKYQVHEQWAFHFDSAPEFWFHLVSKSMYSLL